MFSGVLYHMFDPMSGIGRVRGLLRDGGLLVLETAALLEATMSMTFNAGGRIYPGVNYWFPSVDCMDYLLRFFRLRPIDCCYLEGGPLAGHRHIRCGVVCRAEPGHVARPSDNWMPQQDEGLFDLDLHEVLDFAVTRSELPPLSYAAPLEALENGPLDLHGALEARGPVQPAQHRDLLRLGRSDLY